MEKQAEIALLAGEDWMASESAVISPEGTPALRFVYRGVRSLQFLDFTLSEAED